VIAEEAVQWEFMNSLILTEFLKTVVKTMKLKTEQEEFVLHHKFANNALGLHHLHIKLIKTAAGQSLNSRIIRLSNLVLLLDLK